MPAILRKRANIFVASIERIELALVELAGHANQEVREVDSRLCSGKNKVAVELRDGVCVDLIEMKIAAELHRVIAHHLGQRIGDLIGVVDLDQLVRGRADGVGVEIDILDTLPFGIESNDAIRAVGIDKTLRCKADIATADRLAKIGIVTHVAQVKFVDRHGVETFCVAQRDQLRATGAQRVEAGNTGAALRNWIWIIEIEVVDEVVGGNQAPWRSCIQPQGSLVVA